MRIISSRNTRGVTPRAWRSLQGVEVCHNQWVSEKPVYFCSPDAALGIQTWGDRYKEDCKMQCNKFCVF